MRQDIIKYWYVSYLLNEISRAGSNYPHMEIAYTSIQVRQSLPISTTTSHIERIGSDFGFIF
jgi:hypothetical protein